MKQIPPDTSGNTAPTSPSKGRFLALVLLLALSGCASQSLQPSSPELTARQLWIEQSKQLSNQPQWRLRGRIGMRMPGRALSASIRWQQNQDQTDILLTGPLGQGSVRIMGDDQEIELSSAKNGSITKGNPEQLLRQHLGFAFPLSQLSQWSLGLIEARGSNSFKRLRNESIMDLQFDSQGFPSSFRTASWRVQYRHWKAIPQQHNSVSYTLPHKIILQSDTVKITLAIKHWEIPPHTHP